MTGTDLELTVLGSRGSMACVDPALRDFGGDSSCYLVRAGEETIFLDAGSGMLRAPAHYDRAPLVLLSHLHLDHLIGLGLFPGLSVPGQGLRLYVPFCRSEEEAEEETLGRLRLVRLPGLLSVFAASDRPVAPLFAEQAVTDDSFTARLFSTPGTQVVSILSGKVRSVDPAGEHGGSVTICCADGVDVTYMGLSEILVERGQPVLQRTVLGKLSGEILYLRVTKDGRPIDPLEFLGTAARVG